MKISDTFDPKWFDFLRKATDANMNNPGEIAEEYANDKSPTRFFGCEMVIFKSLSSNARQQR